MSCDEGEFGRGLGQLVQVGDGADQSCEPGGGRGEAGSCGEVVGAYQFEGESGEFGDRFILIFHFFTEGAEGGKTGLGSWSGQGLVLAVEEEGIGGRVGGGAGCCSVGA